APTIQMSALSTVLAGRFRASNCIEVFSSRFEPRCFRTHNARTESRTQAAVSVRKTARQHHVKLFKDDSLFVPPNAYRRRRIVGNQQDSAFMDQQTISVIIPTKAHPA